MNPSLINYVNNCILRQASRLNYIVKSDAPNNMHDLYNSTSLVIWSGASDNTIFQDELVNFAIRALHNRLCKLIDSLQMDGLQ